MCSTLTIRGTNGLISADVPLSNKQINKQAKPYDRFFWTESNFRVFRSSLYYMSYNDLNVYWLPIPFGSDFKTRY